ncbi:hypothetical protein BDC45DRAFT_313704 [Circinella umbellata]|nr:hypothetical protein BDC45DRAFT_313704 [Circinella umbellata]
MHQENQHQDSFGFLPHFPNELFLDTFSALDFPQFIHCLDVGRYWCNQLMNVVWVKMKNVLFQQPPLHQVQNLNNIEERHLVRRWLHGLSMRSDFFLTYHLYILQAVTVVNYVGCSSICQHTSCCTYFFPNSFKIIKKSFFSVQKRRRKAYRILRCHRQWCF